MRRPLNPKNLLAAALGLVLCAPAFALEPSLWLKSLQLSGSLDYQAAGVAAGRTLESQDFSGQSLFRVQGGALWELTPDASGQVSLFKNNRLQSGSGETLGGAAPGGVFSSINVSEAHLKLRRVLGLDHVIGRQFYGEPGDLIVRYGPSAGYVVGLPVTSLDGWRVDKDFGDRRHLSAFVGKTKETNSGGPLTLDNADTDTDLAGVELCCARTRPADFSFRLYQQKFNSGLLIGNARLYVADLRARGSAGRLSYQAELAKDFGESTLIYNNEFRTAAGIGVLADAAYDAGAWRFSGQFGWGSGDNGYDPKKNKTFQSINSDYRPGLIWGGLSAIGAAGGATSLAGYNAPGLSGDGISGLETANLGVTYRPAAWEQLTVDFHAFWFSRSRSETLVPFSNPFNPNPEPITSRTLGDELDLSAVWKHSESISLTFAYGMFLPGSGLKDILTRSLPGEANAPAGTPFFLGSAKVQLASASVAVKF